MSDHKQTFQGIFRLIYFLNMFPMSNAYFVFRTLGFPFTGFVLIYNNRATLLFHGQVCGRACLYTLQMIRAIIVEQYFKEV